MGRNQHVLADTVSAELEIPIRKGRLFLQRILDLVADDLVYTARSELRGLGTFQAYVRPGRIIKHPKTGEPIQVPPKKTIRFRTSRALLERLNQKKRTPKSSYKPAGSRRSRLRPR